VDDLQEIAERNRQERQSEIGPAMAILEEEIEKFFTWFGSLAVAPTLTALRQKFETIREAEFDQRLNQLNHISESDREKIRLMAQSMVRCLLRNPRKPSRMSPIRDVAWIVPKLPATCLALTCTASESRVE